MSRSSSPKSRACLTLVVLLGTATGVYAQPYGYGSPPALPGYGPGAMPLTGTQPPQSMTRDMPLRPAAPVAQPSRPPMAPSGALPFEPAALAQHPAAAAYASLEEGLDKLLAYLGQEKIPNKLQVAAFLDREIAPYFDFEYMAQWVAGPAYERMSESDRQALAAHLEADFLSTLTSRLQHYDGQQLRLLPPRMGPRGAVRVNAAILRPGTYPTKLEFRMYQSDRGWRVYDVVADGQSAAAYYRVQLQRRLGAAPNPAANPLSR